MTDKANVFYISGPMRGKPNLNKALFAEVTAALAEEVEGKILNPAVNFNGEVDRPTTEYLNADLKQVLDATVIVQLPGWQESEGAIREAKLGVWTGKRFMVAVQVPGIQGGGWDFEGIGSPEFSESIRGELLDGAKDLITGDRNNSYGPPDQDFARTAGALTAMGYQGPDGRGLLGHDIAIFVMMVKISRLMWTPTKKDSWQDNAGYSGCGYECAIREQERGEL